MEDDQSDGNISEIGNNSVPEEEEDDEISVSSQGSQGRGGPRVPEAWTRVISFAADNLDAAFQFALSTDLMMAQNLPRHLNPDQASNWTPVFFPKDFVRGNFGLTLENFQLDTDRLLLEG